MLFKVYDNRDMFLQYFSLCVNPKAIGTILFNSDCINAIKVGKVSKAIDIASCSCNYYNWKTNNLTIQFFNTHDAPTIFLTEVLSVQRAKDIKQVKTYDYSVGYVSANTANTSNILYYGLPTTSTTINTTTTTASTLTYTNIGRTVTINNRGI